MPKLSQICVAASLAAGLAACATVDGDARAKEPAPVTDPYQWLEGVTDEKALAWVKAENAKTEAELATTREFRRLETDIRAILDSDAKIPGVEKIGAYYYNLWKDRANERGLWRRTTLDEYRKPDPQWETVIDLDALNKAEGENWVWHGANCLKPAYQRCLVALSRGGADADVTREFDLGSKQWVKDGFFRKEAKGGMDWIDRDNAYVFTDFGKDAAGADSMTQSGYPRIVKQWARGTPIESASVVYAGKDDDMYIAASRDLSPGYQRDFVSRSLAFYNDELYLRGKDGALAKVDAPNSANKLVHKQWLALQLRDPWTVGGRTYQAGALLVTKFDEFMAGKRNFDVVFDPTDTQSLQDVVWTKDYLVTNELHDVKSRVFILRPTPDGWRREPLPNAALPDSVAIAAVDADDSNALWLTTTDYLTPTSLSLVEIGKAPETLKSYPAFFNASTHVSEQRFATSKDGTRVPYFIVRPKNMAFDGSNPTLLYGYGGFEISLTPAYSGSVGKGWLEYSGQRGGGVYVVANIRGGGEYGPRWHQAALKANRYKAYEDFAAVAQDLIDRKVTSPPHLGIQGGSNGGLLMGNMLTRYPQLFGAVVAQVPLLDMQRYDKLLAGASWTAEFGDPDKPEEWRFIRTFSPYHLVKQEAKYPPTLFMTSTRDDRVHPGHARKMMAKMQDMGHDVRYYENIEGGHGGSANNAQAAKMSALAYAFLWQQLK